MTKAIIYSVLSGVLVAIATSSSAMVFDNRFFPLIQKPFISVDGRPSHLAANFFVTTASRALDNNEKEIGIPRLFGEFELGVLSRALDRAGICNPLRSDLRNDKLPFTTAGTLQTQGIEFAYYQSIHDIIGFGFNWMVMRSNSSQVFLSDDVKTVSPDELDRTRRQMFTNIGITQAQSSQFGMGDLDAYMRIGHVWEYALKFKRIDAGARFGVLVPTDVTTDVTAPGSVPFGGNGHWGLYGQLETELELKEDMKTGLLFRFGKRFKKTQVMRLPVAGEPQIFGAVVGPVSIDPGFTLVFMPNVMMENIRAGFGMRLLYTLTKHFGDAWCDERCEKDKEIPVQLKQVENLSTWKSDYFTINIFYDFGKTKVQRTLEPILTLCWDIPSLFFASENVVHSHKISLGLELNF